MLDEMSSTQPAPPRSPTVRDAVRTPFVRAGRQVLRRRNALRRALREPPDGTHLVTDPVFILSSVRSGSTLLRAMLNAHTQICAPHELHLATMRVRTSQAHAKDSWEALDVTERDLANLLWDRALHLLLVRTGKRVVVDKTPQNVAVWPRIHAYWPDARYVHLRRHPGSMYESLLLDSKLSPAQALESIVKYCRQLDEARDALPGPTVRYEDLVTDPEATLRTVCGYLGERYQRRMLNYRVGTTSKAGRGDWSEKIRSGRVQPGRPLPRLADLPVELHDAVRAWGY